MYVIYALVDPRDNNVRYIGVTEDVYARFQQHINCGSGSYAKNAWILELRAANKMVIMSSLEEVSNLQESLERELYWIQHYERLGAPLLNRNGISPLKHIKGPSPADSKGAMPPELINEARRAWNGGANSVGKLMKELGVTNHRAQRLRRHLIAHKLVLN